MLNVQGFFLKPYTELNWLQITLKCELRIMSLKFQMLLDVKKGFFKFQVSLNMIVVSPYVSGLKEKKKKIHINVSYRIIEMMNSPWNGLNHT